MSIFRTWVIDPHQKLFQKKYIIIENLLKNNSKNFKHINTLKLQNGLNAVTYNISNSEKTNLTTSYSLVEILSEISYDPLIITVSLNPESEIQLWPNGPIVKSDFSIDPNLDRDLDLTGIDACIKRNIKSILKINIDFNDIIFYEDYVQFLPYDDNGHRIYTNYDMMGQISNACQLEDVLKYKYIDSDPYLNYLIDKRKLSTSQQDIIIGNQGLMFNSDIDNSEYLDLALISQNLDNDDHYVLGSSNTECDLQLDISLWSEISLLWGFQIVDVDTNQLVIKRSPESPVGKEWSVTSWFEQAKRSIKIGRLIPTLTKGFWQLWDTSKRPMIHYAAYRAYIEDNYANLSSLKINNDFSITADFASLNSYINFKTKLLNYLNRSSDWSVITASNFIDALVKRYELNNYRQNKNLLIDTGDHVYIVTDIDTNEFSFIGKRQEFESALRSFFNNCQKIYGSDGFPINLNDLSLYDLLDIVYTNDKHIMCFHKDILDTIDLMKLPLEPLLITDENIQRYQNLYYALSGYFDFGPLRGIYQKPPKRDITVPEGTIYTTYIEDYNRSTSPVLSVTFISDLGQRELFQIATPDIIKVQNLVDILWSSGWFLSDWGIEYYKKTGALSLSLIRNIPFLRIAADSPQRGYMALYLLERIVKIMFEGNNLLTSGSSDNLLNF